MINEQILKAIFREVEEVRDKARKSAEQKYPTLLPFGEAEEYAKDVEEMEDRLLKELCLKYGITGDQLDTIEREGLLKGWSSIFLEE